MHASHLLNHTTRSKTNMRAALSEVYQSSSGITSLFRSADRSTTAVSRIDPRPPTARRVIVAGGGLAGSMMAHLLEKDFEVTLVDSKEYHEISWSTVAAMIDPKVADRIVIPHLEYLQRSKVIVGVIKSTTEKEIIMDDGQIHEFDILIIATGNKPEPPIPFQDRVWYFYKQRKRIEDANTLLVVGGGVVGVEFAAEVISTFPDKKVTIVHSGGHLLQTMKPRAGILAQHWLEKKGVKVILDDRVKIDLSKQETGHGGTFHTARGRQIETEFLFVAIGKRPCISWLRATFDDAIDENGRIRVDAMFTLQGHRHVFAIGDITNLKEAKRGTFAHEHAKRVAAHLKNMIKGGDLPPVKPYVPTPDVHFVSLGKFNGVGQTASPLGTIVASMPSILNGRGASQVEKARKDLGLTF